MVPIPSSLFISAAVAVMPNEERVYVVFSHGTLTYACPEEFSSTG